VSASALLDRNDAPGVHAASWYADTAVGRRERPPLDGDRRADVVVVGAGYTGLSAALHLAEAGADVVVLDAHRAGWGASGRNGGQLVSGQRRDPDELEARYGLAAARRLYALGEDAKALVHDLCARHAIACDYRPGLLYATRRRGGARALERYAERLAGRYGYPHARFVPGAELRALVKSPRLHAGVLDEGAGHLHPLTYALGLARAAETAGATLCDLSRVEAVEPGPHGVAVHTSRGTVRAGHAVVAGNGYLGGLAPAVAARVMPINNFIVATAPLGAAGIGEVFGRDLAAADSRFVINYFRPTPDHRLLFGGGETYRYRFPRDIAALVRSPLEDLFPQLRGVALDYAWGGTLAITRSRLPHLARPAPNVLAAGGYSGQGVALATLAGKLMAEAIRGESAGFDAFAAVPQAAFPGGQPLRWPLLALGMSWFALRDRLGF
jgi:gamma-glutamylputrescine oxidase